MNKKHYFLDNKEWLLDVLCSGAMSLTEFCAIYDLKIGSLRWAIRDWPEEKKKMIKQERRFHTNTKR